MISKDKKKEVVAGLIENFENASGVYLVNFKGMTVEDAIRIRREMKKESIVYKVAKNTLIKRALKDNEYFQFPDEVFQGETAVVLGYDDPILPAKIIKKEHDKHERPVLKSAMFEGQLFGADQLKQLAAMPSKTDMIASICGSLNAPASGIVGSIGGVIRELASVIEEVAKKEN